MSQTWLITGGAGFIGSHFVHMALADQPQCKIIILDALTYAGSLMRLNNIIEDKRLTFVQGSICNAKLIDNIFCKNEIDAVINFAAETHVDRSIYQPQDFFKTNIEGTFILLESARKYWQTNSADKRFVQISTDEVFGSLLSEQPAFTELARYNPSNPYSAAKVAADSLVQAWQITYGLPTIITHCSNNYGPWQYPEKFIPLVITHALENKRIPIYGNGLQQRNWLHVFDHCRAIQMILQKGRVGEQYVIGGDIEITNLELANLICELVDELNHTRKTKDLITHVKDRLAHDIRYALDTTKLSTELGWNPEYDFKASLKELIVWYQANKAWINQVRNKNYTEFYQRNYSIT